MEIYSIDQIRDIQAEQKYKFIGLNTSEGKEVIKQNNATITPENKLDIIETRLKAPKFKDGYYVVYCRSHHSSEPDNYTIVKGDPQSISESAPIPEPMQKSDNVLSYKEAISMNKEIADLKADNTALIKERDQIQRDYDELLQEATEMEEENQNQLSETPANSNNLTTALTEIATTIAPIFDRHYDIQEQKLLIQRGELMRHLQQDQDRAAGNGQPPSPSPENEGQFVELSNEQIEAMGSEEYQRYRNVLLVHLAHHDPERYKQMMAEIKGEVQDD